MERTLIVGCGYTGTALARRLLSGSTEVFGTGKRGGPEDAVPGLQRVELDLLDSGPLSLPQAAGAVVYYMVSTLHRAYAPERPHLLPLRRCLDAVGSEPLRGLIYLSSTSVYGDRAGGRVDEETPPAPRSPWARMRVELEQAVWDFGDARGVPTCVARLPEIYGPGRGPQQRIQNPAYRLGHPERFSNRIHIDDLTTVLSLLGERLEPRLLLVSDDEPARSGDVYALTARLLGQELRVEAEDDGIEGGDATRDANTRALRQESKRCDNSRLRGWLGRPLKYPTYREGIVAALSGR